MNKNFASHTLHFEWDNVKIELCYQHKRFGVIDHIEIRSIDPAHAPLPITQTGYRSHFISDDELQDFDSPLDFVQTWMRVEAAKPHWMGQSHTPAQYSLF